MNNKIIFALIALALVIGNGVYLYPKYQIFSVASKFEATPEIVAFANSGQETVQTSLANGVISSDNFKSNPLPEDIAAFATLFKRAKSGPLFRVKIWNNDHYVIWSNAPELIGKRFPTNEEVTELYAGISHAIESKLNSSGELNETMSESTYNNYIELYLPVKDSAGKITGVIEFYYVVESVILQYKNAFYTSMATTVGTSFVLLIVVWFLLKKKSSQPLIT